MCVYCDHSVNISRLLILCIAEPDALPREMDGLPKEVRSHVGNGGEPRVSDALQGSTAFAWLIHIIGELARSLRDIGSQ
jgi:hypothetical protein